VQFELQPRPYHDPDVERLVAEVQSEYVVRYGGPDSAVVDADEFSPPDGLFLVGLLDGVPVATGGWRRLASDDLADVEPGHPEIAEIKRMYVVSPARRRGLARLMLAELERSAARAGIAELVLNTGPAQPEAVALYEAAGYLRAPGFGHYACQEDALFYGKVLDQLQQTAAARSAGAERAVQVG
jgi:GNAT superfamily N-acetyltransferase